ncbi:MAG: hypothetical protein JWO44_2641 [Bacteroidetes bacterium]|nr:hypothetical protein [Bacteroidota bacterium]
MNFAETFEKNSYLILKKIVPDETISMIAGYCNFIKKEKSSQAKAYEHDTEYKKSIQVYGDKLSESLLLQLQPMLEKTLERQLIPTYSLIRIYSKGDELYRHKDRDACEISCTMTINYDGEKLWPICIESNQQELKINLDRGDFMVYKGREVLHWRNKFETGEYWVQIFLHFVDANGPFAKLKYDGREGLAVQTRPKRKTVFFSNPLSLFTRKQKM